MKSICSVLLTAFLATSSASAAKLQHVIVIAMENTDRDAIYGNVKDAPFINNVLMPTGARAMNFEDELDLVFKSEPHYIWMEAGSNAFPDHRFMGDYAVSAKNSTASNNHLIAQIETAKLAWMTYQDGLAKDFTGCPIDDNDNYVARHNPFVFFQDISGSPPDDANEYCAAHTKPFESFSADLKANSLADYVFITPDLCHDMHDKCGEASAIVNGEQWLADRLPPMIDWANKNAGVIFITWDEGRDTKYLPFFAIGTGVKANYASTETYTHSAIIRTVERIFGLPVLPKVKDSPDFSDLFTEGVLP